MRPRARRAGLRLALLLLLSALARPEVAFAQVQGAPPGTFDFYVLSLSWSPSYCAAEGADASPRQCGPGRTYAFIVHGLWPQYERGYPEFCPSNEPARVPQALVEATLDIMPSAGLIGHQWRKHGTCSGLGQEDYFALLRRARERVAVPPELARAGAPRMVAPQAVEAGFIAANPGLEEDGIAVTCDRRYLREVRICMTRDLDFRPCPEVARRDCRRDRMLMPSTRGG